MDGLVKSRKFSRIVISAEASIKKYQIVTKHWTSGSIGVTIFYGGIKIAIRRSGLLAIISVRIFYEGISIGLGK